MRLRLLVLLFLFLRVSFGLVAQNFNRPVPPEVFPYEFQAFGEQDFGYFLLTPFKLFLLSSHPEYIHPKAVMLDENGYLLWFQDEYLGPNASGLAYQKSRDRFLFKRLNHTLQTEYVRLNPALELESNFPAADNLTGDTHEFLITDDGHQFIFALDYRNYDLSDFSFDGVQGSANTRVRCMVVQEFDARDSLVWSWNSCDIIDPTEAYEAYDYRAFDYDAYHGNAIEVDFDGHLLLSFRHLNAIYKIHRQNGQIIWQLGGKSSSFQFANDHGFSAQHDARRLENGRISLYDNGNMTAPPSLFARGGVRIGYGKLDRYPPLGICARAKDLRPRNG